MTEKLEDKLGDTLEGICPNCNKKSKMTYVGPLDIRRKKNQIYRCNNEDCGAYTTLTRYKEHQPTAL